MKYKERQAIWNLEEMLIESNMTIGQSKIIEALINLIKNQKELPIKYKKLINKHFWELI